MAGIFEFEVELVAAKLGISEKAEEIIQNVRNIFATPLGSVPSARSLGVDMGFIDRPPQVAKTLAVAALHNAIRSEPRAEIASIEFKTKADGKTGVKVRIKMKDE